MNILKVFILSLVDLLTMPFAKVQSYTFKNPPISWSEGKKGDVILVQGFGGRWSYMSKIGDFVNSLGYKIHVLQKLGHNTYKIEKSARILEDYIREKGIKNAIVICHSKGGIITKYFLVHSRFSNKIRKVISISVPFKGAILAYSSILNIHELTTSSKIIKDLIKNIEVNKKFINIFGIDNVVIPNKNLYLTNSTNTKLDIVGHLKIIKSDKTLKEIEKILANNI